MLETPARVRFLYTSNRWIPISTLEDYIAWFGKPSKLIQCWFLNEGPFYFIKRVVGNED